MPVLWGKGKEDTDTRKRPPTTQNVGMLSLAEAQRAGEGGWEFELSAPARL